MGWYMATVTKAKQTQAGQHYHGHRQRLRQKLLDKGAGALADYELLEILLFGSNPRGDVKPLAKMLLAEFGSLANVLRASPRALQDVPGVGDVALATLKSAEAVALKLLEADMQEKPVIRNWDNVIHYCRAAIGFAEVEHFYLLFLDTKNQIIRHEIQHSGTINQTAIYPREVVRRALDVGAAALIMVHNHPSGDVTPSTADLEMTRQVMEALKPVGIALHDHVIVTRTDHASFRSMGLI